MDTENYVAKLNELAQKQSYNVRYVDVGSEGPAHIKTFTIKVLLNGKDFPEGVGKNKKEARQSAAKNALIGLQEESSREVLKEVKEVPTAEVPQTNILNYVSWLNNYGQQNRLEIKHVETTELGAVAAPQCCRFVVGETEYPAANGKTKKEAKEAAAKLVYNEIYGSQTTEISSGANVQTDASRQQKEDFSQKMPEIRDLSKSPSIKMEPYCVNETNHIALLNNYLQKNGCIHTYLEVKRWGPPHNLQFSYKLQIDGKEYPEGEGKTVKEAKQNAAKMAWLTLNDKSSVYSAVPAQDSSPKQSKPSSTQ